MKYLSMIAWTLGVFLVLSGINTLFNWEFEFLIGWFTVSTWFAVTNWYKYKRLTIDPHWNLGNWFISIGIAVIVLVVLKAFFATIQVQSDLAEGFIVGYFYNFVSNELDKRELEKIEKK